MTDFTSPLSSSCRVTISTGALGPLLPPSQPVPRPSARAALICSRECAICIREGDPDLRDTEIVPFKYEGGISAFMANEVLTYAPDAWVDEKSTKIGYEISFTKYFYKPAKLREAREIVDSLKSLDVQADEMMSRIMEGL